MFNHYNHLGFHNPYYLKSDEYFHIQNRLEDVLTLDIKKDFDFTALVQVLTAGFPFGDRTLIKGINKTPWMARSSQDLKAWEYFDVPYHKENFFDVDEIEETFFQLLKSELLSYIGDKKSIGLLLTGGMDSRIVACVLSNLIKEGDLKNISVIGITWGQANSRDVVYAQKICSIYNWEWTHLIVDAEQMYNNIHLTAEMGCEFSPIHLHAMEKVSKIEGLDCVIGGSFGDSVGRAEFSGVKVQNLSSLLSKLKKSTGILRDDYYELSYNDSKNDIEKYHRLFPQEKEYMLYEQDQQLHYMRRMLNACMSLIDKTIPLYQMFSAPSVYGYIWSIHPDLRGDFLYKVILEKYGKELSDIPWARTGKPYMKNDVAPDHYSKSHHNYGELLRKELYPELENLIKKSSLLESKILNKTNVNALLVACRNFPIKGSYFYEEKLAYLASLSIFLEKNQINIKMDDSPAYWKNTIKPISVYFTKFIKKSVIS